VEKHTYRSDLVDIHNLRPNYYIQQILKHLQGLLVPELGLVFVIASRARRKEKGKKMDRCELCLQCLEKITNLNNERVIRCDYLKKYILATLFNNCLDFKEESNATTSRQED